eukprot:COSAG02_NODE_150_length_33596_cov_61.953966_25_plen_708_part_00
MQTKGCRQRGAPRPSALRRAVTPTAVPNAPDQRWRRSAFLYAHQQRCGSAPVMAAAQTAMLDGPVAATAGEENEMRQPTDAVEFLKVGDQEKSEECKQLPSSQVAKADKGICRKVPAIVPAGWVPHSSRDYSRLQLLNELYERGLSTDGSLQELRERFAQNKALPKKSAEQLKAKVPAIVPAGWVPHSSRDYSRLQLLNELYERGLSTDGSLQELRERFAQNKALPKKSAEQLKAAQKKKAAKAQKKKAAKAQKMTPDTKQKNALADRSNSRTNNFDDDGATCSEEEDEEDGATSSEEEDGATSSEEEDGATSSEIWTVSRTSKTVITLLKVRRGLRWTPKEEKHLVKVVKSNPGLSWARLAKLHSLSSRSFRTPKALHVRLNKLRQKAGPHQKAVKAIKKREAVRKFNKVRLAARRETQQPIVSSRSKTFTRVVYRGEEIKQVLAKDISGEMDQTWSDMMKVITLCPDDPAAPLPDVDFDVHYAEDTTTKWSITHVKGIVCSRDLSEQQQQRNVVNQLLRATNRDGYKRRYWGGTNHPVKRGLLQHSGASGPVKSAFKLQFEHGCYPAGVVMDVFETPFSFYEIEGAIVEAELELGTSIDNNANAATGTFKYVYCLSVDMHSALKFEEFEKNFKGSAEQCLYEAEKARKQEARSATKKAVETAKADAIRDGFPGCFKCRLPHGEAWCMCPGIFKDQKHFVEHLRRY